MKQSIDKCLSEYTTKELMTFHANLNALFLCCSTDFHLLPLLLQVQFALSQRKETIVEKYLTAIETMLKPQENI